MGTITFGRDLVFSESPASDSLSARAIRKATSEQDVFKAYENFVRRLGFAAYGVSTVSSIRSSGLEVKTVGCAPGIIAREGGVHGKRPTKNKILFRCLRTHVPFAGLKYMETVPDALKRYAKLWIEQVTRRGFNEILVVPVHNGSGDRATTLVSFLYWPGDPDDFDNVVMPLAGYAHDATLSLNFWLRRNDTIGAPKKLPLLTERERMCLEWFAAGMTSLEMADILGVKKATVEFHVQNLMSKLDATSRPHAVALAISLNLITV